MTVSRVLSDIIYIYRVWKQWKQIFIYKYVIGKLGAYVYTYIRLIRLICTTI